MFVTSKTWQGSCEIICVVTPYIFFHIALITQTQTKNLYFSFFFFSFFSSTRSLNFLIFLFSFSFTFHQIKPHAISFSYIYYFSFPGHLLWQFMKNISCKLLHFFMHETSWILCIFLTWACKPFNGLLANVKLLSLTIQAIPT